MSNTKEDLIRYRIARAKDTLEDAQILADRRKWNSAINRLYYAAYYAVIALLLSVDLKPTTHNGAKSNFSEYFVKTGKIDKEFGKVFSQLFTWRQKGDYDDLFDFQEEKASFGWRGRQALTNFWRRDILYRDRCVSDHLSIFCNRDNLPVT